MVIKHKNRKSAAAASIKALENEIKKDKVEAAKGLTLDPIAKQLLERGIDLIEHSNSTGLDDPIARAKADGHRELLTACKGNLATAIRVIMETPTVDDLTKVDRRGGRVFSLLSTVMKRVMFLASGRYHLWLNGKDQPLFASRDETRPPPYGLDFGSEDAYVDVQLKNAVEQLQALFGSMANAAGYELEDRPFPLAYEEDPIKGWQPVTDLDLAYNVIEQRAQASKVKRLEEQAKLRKEQIARALEIMEKSLA